MFTITRSSDSYYEINPVSMGILVRGDLAGCWSMVEEIKNAAPSLPVLICCFSGPADSSKSELHRFKLSTLIESHRTISPGEGVNEIMHRSLSPRTFIIWSDMKLLSESMFSPPAFPEALCVSPLLEDSASRKLPRVIVPHHEERYIRFVPFVEGRNSLMPHDYTGLYDTPLFLSLGGYAPSFINPFWQLADFGSRAFMWGYSVVQDDIYHLGYHRRPPVYDQSKDIDYIRWYRRNCSVQRIRGKLVRRKLFLHQRAREEQDWVKKNFHRFMRSMEEVISSWDQL